MSTSATDLQEIFLADKLWVLTNYTSFSSAILWILDFFYTLPMEIEAVWSRNLTGTSIIFLLNRYVYAIYLINHAKAMFPGSGSDESCDALYILDFVLENLTLVTTKLLFTLRVYAICGRNKAVVSVAFAIIIGGSGVNIWNSTFAVGRSTRNSQFNAFSACFGAIRYRDWHDRFVVRLLTSIFPLVFDFFVFGVTLFKIYRHVMEMRHHGQKGITEIMLRDGTLYFFIVFMVAVASLALQMISLANAGSENWFLLGEVMVRYFSVLPNILVNRLFLNLRALNPPHSAVLNNDDESRPEPAFARNRFLGNIGAPLDPDWWNTRFDDEDDQILDETSVRAEQNSIMLAVNTGVVTLVPVVYEGENLGDIEMVPMQRASALCAGSLDVVM